METEKTDRTILNKGLQTMGICLLLMFAGPTLLHIALSNKEKSLYIPLLIVSIVLCIGAVYFGFKGIRTIMDSMFGKRKSS